MDFSVDENKKAKNCFLVNMSIIILLALIISIIVIYVDPFMHYHSPRTDKFFYTLDNQRSQNDGIIKNFDYNAIIVGTSMTENFKTTEMDAIFGVNSIKIPYAGARYKEINEAIEVALENGKPEIIVRCIDTDFIFYEKDATRLELGDYPTYLYDSKLINDIKYLFNRDVIWNRIYPMIIDENVGITSFDEYSRWHEYSTYGVNTVCPNGVENVEKGKAKYMTLEEKIRLEENINQNLVALPQKYPDSTFYYFFPPYSIVWWADKVKDGTVYKQIEAEKLCVEKMIEYDNIKIFAFNQQTDIITNLNWYKDKAHYGSWLNSLFIKWMYEDKYLLDKSNYEIYFNNLLKFVSNYNYKELGYQIDYYDDDQVILLYDK